MEAQKQGKLFAFKLAEKQAQEVTPATQWKVREGVSVAGCTDPTGLGDYRDGSIFPPRQDNGVWC